MKRIATILAFGFLLSSCVMEPDGYYVVINNETKQDILIEVGFDRQVLEKAWNGRSYTPFLTSYPNNASDGDAIRFDTTNLTKTYRFSTGL
jgi:hypothetical protein